MESNSAATTIGVVCPCGSEKDYGYCCALFHQSKAVPCPEALMRSRYSAFVLRNSDYLMDTWAPATRPATLSNDDSVCWHNLEVVSASEAGDIGTVSFKATFTEEGQWRQLREVSRFSRVEGRWFYLDGKAEWLRLQIGRNDPCPCDSQKKFKKCCDV